MLSLELLQRAADSLGMKASAHGTSLKVSLFSGVELSISDQAGQRTKSVEFGGFPEWAWALGVGLLSVACAIFLIRDAQLGRSMYVVFLAVLSGSVASWLTVDRAERAQIRLNDRAYLLSKAAAVNDRS